jgi:5,10-methylenetetrahydromethanopterin reductase
MAPHDGLRVSLTLQGVHPPEELFAIARTADESGFFGLWLTDSSLHSRDCWTLLGALALRTERLRLGTAVTHPRTRHPALAAVCAATLDELSGGRAILGVGAGDRPVTELGRRPARIAEVEAMISLCRALLRGESVEAGPPFTVRGGFRRLEASPDLPVWIAGSGPRMLDLGGRAADGVLALVGTCEPCVQSVLGEVGRAAESVGRPAPEIALMGYGAISDDGEAAWKASRSMAAWFAKTAPRYCDLAGIDPALVARIRDSYSGGEFTEATAAAELAPREMVERLTLSGTPDEVSDHLDRLERAGVRHVNYFPIGPDRLGSFRAFADVVRARSARRPAA